jgi:hypothetical protein
MRGHNILEGVVIQYINSTTRNLKNGVIVKTKFEKAYDKVR